MSEAPHKKTPGVSVSLIPQECFKSLDQYYKHVDALNHEHILPNVSVLAYKILFPSWCADFVRISNFCQGISQSSLHLKHGTSTGWVCSLSLIHQDISAPLPFASLQSACLPGELMILVAAFLNFWLNFPPSPQHSFLLKIKPPRNWLSSPTAQFVIKLGQQWDWFGELI